MASDVNTPGSSIPHLDSGETSLLGLAGDDRRDAVLLSDKEALILKLHRQLQEQRLERAFLEEEEDVLFGDDAETQLAAAERELLEARATYTVQRKAVEAVLMTDPALKAVHLKAMSPPERALFGLINRRDVLSLALENLITARNSTLADLSDLELENLRINQKNQELVRELLQLTSSDLSWQDKVKDAGLKDQLERLEADERKVRANWDIMKNIASAIVVGSGVNWAEDEVLRALVLDEEE